MAQIHVSSKGFPCCNALASVSNNLHIFLEADEDFNDNNDDTSTASRTRNGLNDALIIFHSAPNAIPVCEPEPRIVVNQHFPFFDKSASRYTTANDPLLKLLRYRKYFDMEREIERDVEASMASSCKVR